MQLYFIANKTITDNFMPMLRRSRITARQLSLTLYFLSITGCSRVLPLNWPHILSLSLFGAVRWDLITICYSCSIKKKEKKKGTPLVPCLRRHYFSECSRAVARVVNNWNNLKCELSFHVVQLGQVTPWLLFWFEKGFNEMEE